MMLYLTGASNSVVKSGEIAQTDVSKSLGGFISSSPVPNGSINSLFDMISLSTLKNKPQETVALGLVNKFDNAVRNVKMRLVTKKDNIGRFKVAVVETDEELCMEHIENRNAEPIQADFYDIDFYKASVIGSISREATAGEIIVINPFDVEVEVEQGGLDGTMDAILNAFAASDGYTAEKLSEREFQVTSKDDNVVTEPLTCDAVCSENAEITFTSEYKNEKNNEVTIVEELAPGAALGMWIQRNIEPKKISDEELIKMYDNVIKEGEKEEVELVVSYDLADEDEDDGSGS